MLNGELHLGFHSNPSVFMIYIFFFSNKKFKCLNLCCIYLCSTVFLISYLFFKICLTAFPCNVPYQRLFSQLKPEEKSKGVKDKMSHSFLLNMFLITLLTHRMLVCVIRNGGLCSSKICLKSLVLWIGCL